MTMQARPVPVLKTFFEPSAQKMKLYPAPVVDPFEPGFGEPVVNSAYRNQQGDVILNVGYVGWYILDAESSTAYKLPRGGYSGSQMKFEASFTNELDNGYDEAARLEVNETEGQASMKAS